MAEEPKVTRYGGPDYDEEGFVSIWVAIVPLEEIPDDYFEERYGDDDQPLTQLYEDFGFGWFDHDSVDSNGTGGEAGPLDRLIGECSFSASYQAEAMARAEVLGFSQSSWILLLYDFHYDSKKSGIEKSPYMQFLGSFRYESEAESVYEPGGN